MVRIFGLAAILAATIALPSDNPYLHSPAEMTTKQVTKSKRDLNQQKFKSDTNRIVRASIAFHRENYDPDNPECYIDQLLSKGQQEGKIDISIIDKKNIEDIVAEVTKQRTYIADANRVLTTFANRLSSNQKDELIDMLLLKHRPDAYYGYSAVAPSFYFHDIISMYEKGKLTLNQRQLERVIKGGLELGNDIFARHMLANYEDSLPTQELARAQEQVASGGYLSFGLKHISQIKPEKMKSASQIQVVVHPFYKPFFSVNVDPSYAPTHKGLEEQAGILLTNPYHIVAGIELQNELQGLDQFGEDQITILVLPPADPLNHANTNKSHIKDQASTRNYAHFLKDNLPDRDNTFYVESKSSSSGTLAPRDISFLDDNLAKDVSITVQGGYLKKCMFTTSLDLAGLGRPMTLDVANSSRKNATTKQEFVTDSNLSAQKVLDFDYNQLALGAHYADVAHAFQPNLERLRAANTFVELTY